MEFEKCTYYDAHGFVWGDSVARNDANEAGGQNQLARATHERAVEKLESRYGIGLLIVR